LMKMEASGPISGIANWQKEKNRGERKWGIVPRGRVEWGMERYGGVFSRSDELRRRARSSTISPVKKRMARKGGRFAKWELEIGVRVPRWSHQKSSNLPTQIKNERSTERVGTSG